MFRREKPNKLNHCDVCEIDEQNGLTMLLFSRNGEEQMLSMCRRCAYKFYGHMVSRISSEALLQAVDDLLTGVADQGVEIDA